MTTATAPGHGSGNADVDRARILIVEDSPAERMRLVAMLRGHGHASDTAANGAEALRLLEQQSFDLVISDWVMPVVDGLQLCRALAAQRHPAPPYFIMLTGRIDRGDLIAGMDAGADDFIAKPASAEELRVRVQAGLRQLRLRAELLARSRELERTIALQGRV